MNIEEHFKEIEKKVNEAYELANKARAKGYDPVDKVEVPIATSLAEKAVGLISVVHPQLLGSGVVERILELEREYGQLDMAVPFKIAEEIAHEKYCKFGSQLVAIDAGIRVGFSYITLGVVSSPIEGFTELKLGKTSDGREYFKAYFSGPIRSAGTTAGCMTLMLIDYLRDHFGYAKYDPNESEVKRYVTENYDYHERVTNLQYLPTQEEIAFLAKNLPIEITGEPSEEREVSNYKDLPRIETNQIRGGMCLIFSEGLAQKAAKGLRLWKGIQTKGIAVRGWEFLDEYIALHKKREKGTSDTSPTYIKDIVAGRPVFSHPSRQGGFRFRYGKTRANGFSAFSLHPATMAITDNFISLGTQLKIEKPTKGGIVTACEEIDGPIVKLKNGSVKKLNTLEEARKLYKDVDEIIHLGDVLFPYGDVANRNYELIKPGYVEEWWALQLAKANPEEKVDKFNVSFDDAVQLSLKYNLPLYPKYIFYWRELDYEIFLGLVDWIAHSEIREGKLVLPYNHQEKERFQKGKRALELIGVEHEVVIENVVIDNVHTRALLFNFGIEDLNIKLHDSIDSKIGVIKESKDKSVLEIINLLSKIKVKDKSGGYMGARMGRPEKAKLRKLIGSPHALFPVGEEGGRLRSFQAALEKGFVNSEFAVYYCENCKREEISPRCLKCSGICKRSYYCKECDKVSLNKCEIHEQGQEYRRKSIEIKEYFDSVRAKLGVRNEEVQLVKGVRGTSNKDHSCENLMKGILRAKYNLHVNKDGTIRYDMTEMPISHFKAREIGTSVAKLKELGYEKDVSGNPLENDEQLIEMFPHDVLLPSCPETADERADDVVFNIAKFLDDELENLYGVEKYFNANKKEDIVGQLVVCIAPHICTATVGRIIGFTKAQALVASPYMHAAMRRDCDGDEAAFMMLMDMLLNFSRKFLPAHRGGTQDAPLVLNTRIRAGEVDDQILDLEVGAYPLELYELAEQGKHSSEIKTIENVKQRLKKGIDPFTNLYCTHNVKDFNHAPINSSYKSLPTMHDKVDKMMILDRKIRAVDVRDVARLIIERHFIRDIKGNLRKFSQQEFRCVGCNTKYRRPPLQGKCGKCGGRLIFTIAEGSVLKYMQPALDIARQFNVSPYLLENLELTEMFIQSVFGKEKEKQMKLF